MIHEIRRIRLGQQEPICIFCGTQVGFGDYLYKCKKHGDGYYKIPRIFRILLPKIIIKYFVMQDRENVNK